MPLAVSFLGLRDVCMGRRVAEVNESGDVVANTAICPGREEIAIAVLRRRDA